MYFVWIKLVLINGSWRASDVPTFLKKRHSPIQVQSTLSYAAILPTRFTEFKNVKQSVLNSRECPGFANTFQQYSGYYVDSFVTEFLAQTRLAQLTTRHEFSLWDLLLHIVAYCLTRIPNTVSRTFLLSTHIAAISISVLISIIHFQHLQFSLWNELTRSKSWLPFYCSEYFINYLTKCVLQFKTCWRNSLLFSWSNSRRTTIAHAARALPRSSLRMNGILNAIDRHNWAVEPYSTCTWHRPCAVFLLDTDLVQLLYLTPTLCSVCTWHRPCAVFVLDTDHVQCLYLTPTLCSVCTWHRPCAVFVLDTDHVQCLNLTQTLCSVCTWHRPCAVFVLDTDHVQCLYLTPTLCSVCTWHQPREMYIQQCCDRIFCIDFFQYESTFFFSFRFPRLWWEMSATTAFMTSCAIYRPISRNWLLL